MDHSLNLCPEHTVEFEQDGRALEAWLKLRENKQADRLAVAWEKESQAAIAERLKKSKAFELHVGLSPIGKEKL